jgi:hypothetical protein
LTDWDLRGWGIENVYAVFQNATPTESSTWARIKALYED